MTKVSIGLTWTLGNSCPCMYLHHCMFYPCAKSGGTGKLFPEESLYSLQIYAKS